MSQHGCPERLSNRSKGFQDDGPSQPTMEVLVETLTGTAFEMTVLPTDTILAIKSKIFRVEGIPVSQQHLLYNLKELEDSSSLREHSISDGARLRLVLGMRGGPISTRRLPPPPNAEPWRDIERLLESNREEVEWGSSGCKVTVLVFRDGERVNMLRVKENHDGTYSPLEQNKYSSPSASPPLGSRPRSPAPPAPPARSLHDNALTASKMLDLRRRMESLSVQRAGLGAKGDKVEIQKTRSEETLSVPSLLDESSERAERSFPYDEDSFAPLYDGNYTRYDYDCSFSDRYSLLPPIGARAESEQSVAPARDLPAVPVADYGRGSHSQSASALHVRAAPPRRAPPLSDALFSSSTSDLEKLKRNSRTLPALSRHRPRSQLHLSDSSLDGAPEAGAGGGAGGAGRRARCALCRRRLSVATLHRCRCGGAFCAPHRYAEAHGCAWDYRAPPAPAHPPRLPRI